MQATTPRARAIALVVASLTTTAVACSKESSKSEPTKSEPTKSDPTKSEPTPADITPEQRTRAAALIGDLKKSLLGALTTALGNGVPAAIATCHTDAPALAAAVSREGAVVGRATDKPRNAKNAASGWQADALAHFAQLKASGTALQGQSYARVLPDGRAAYAEPLVIQEICLNCHGASIAPEVKDVLAAKYPDDRATGYALGDLRGVAWVELPAK